MRNNAISISNYLIEKSEVITCKKLKLLGLMKRVYFVHGFSLAITGEPAIDNRFDKVEAWKYGPVIPSIYHTFKYNGNNDISELGKIIDFEKDDYPSEVPKLEDENLKAICEMVLKRYINFSDRDIVDLTHQKNTPWDIVYKNGLNIEIDDRLTKMYFEEIIKKSNDC